MACYEPYIFCPNLELSAINFLASAYNLSIAISD